MGAKLGKKDAILLVDCRKIMGQSIQKEFSVARNSQTTQ